MSVAPEPETCTRSYRANHGHRLIGDSRTVAVVAANGTIAWLCWPHVDSPSVFGARPDGQRGGFFRIAAIPHAPAKQLYVSGTSILTTRYLSHRRVLAKAARGNPTARAGRTPARTGPPSRISECSAAKPCTKDASACLRRDNMHPMFIALFIEADDDDLVAEEGRRHVRRSRRARSAMVRPAARNRPHRPRP